jgi:hypothetical protein
MLLVALSLIAPFLFLGTGAPNVLLGVASLALATAGVIAASAAVRGQLRRRADATIRPRASIAQSGITLHQYPTSRRADRHFAATEIKYARLTPGALIIQTAGAHAKPGRHVLRFGKLTTPREALLVALAPFNH